MTNQQNSSQLAILETQLVEVEEQLNAPSLLRQQRAAKLRELERESQEKELSATNAARRYEDLASANLKLNAAMA